MEGRQVKRFKQDTEYEEDLKSSHEDLDDTSSSFEYKHKTRIELSETCSPKVASKEVRPCTSELILHIEEKQSQDLLQLDYSSSKVTHIYNPLEYASETHSYYVRQYGNGPKQVMFLGMNPGPFGMAQNGVPFGNITHVKDWLHIKGLVNKPVNEHPKRPILGLSCSRNEVSGMRFWGLVKALWKTPEEFFKTCYVHNYCPLCFMMSSAKNVTPPTLKCSERTRLESICDSALLEVIELLEVKIVVCVGKYVERRVKAVLKDFEKWKIQVGAITHPSPINPNANKGDWVAMATQQLQELNVITTT